jgi:hypothetical protein
MKGFHKNTQTIGFHRNKTKSCFCSALCLRVRTMPFKIGTGIGPEANKPATREKQNSSHARAAN